MKHSFNILAATLSYIVLVSMIICFLNSPELYCFEEKAKEGIELTLEDSDEDLKSYHLYLHSRADYQLAFCSLGMVENTIDFVCNQQSSPRLFLLYGQMKTDIC